QQDNGSCQGSRCRRVYIWRSCATLPVASGLFVDAVGGISTPLTDDQAPKLVTRCEKSRTDTVENAEMRNNWQLDPKYVQFKNPLWQSGMDKLRDSIAERLGYKDPGTMRFAKVAGIWGRSHIETPGDEEPGRYGGHTASSATESVRRRQNLSRLRKRQRRGRIFATIRRLLRRCGVCVGEGDKGISLDSVVFHLLATDNAPLK
ncbi:hypothetical protein JG687_00015643, partial [Phytophthora cactorum]